MNDLILGDCFNALESIKDGSIDLILTDPPYKYLNHKLESDWDEKLFFTHAKRVLKKDGFLVFFGAKESYFRWNCICLDLGLKFKEQLIWDKARISNPMCAIPRSHENISVFTKGKGTLNEVRINKIEYDLLANPKAIVKDFDRLLCSLKRIQNWDDFCAFRDGSFRKQRHTTKHKATVGSIKWDVDAGCQIYQSHAKGRKLPSILRVLNDHYGYIHPTQKPLELVKNLILLTTKAGDVVLDPFAGSATTAIAALETDRSYICVEVLEAYYNAGNARIDKWHEGGKQLSLFPVA